MISPGYEFRGHPFDVAGFQCASGIMALPPNLDARARFELAWNLRSSGLQSVAFDLLATLRLNFGGTDLRKDTSASLRYRTLA